MYGLPPVIIALSHGEGLVFFCLHDFALARALVVDATKVQDAVDDDAVQLFVVRAAKLLGIAAHGVERDDDVAIDGVALIVVEGDDVGEIVVAQILAVDFEYLLVVDKEIAYLSHFSAM